MNETLVDLLRARAAEQPDRIGYRFIHEATGQHTEVTYGELDSAARRIGSFLSSRGASGERILLFGTTGIDFVLPFFGILYAGATAVPLSPPPRSKSLSRIETVVHDADPKIAIAPSLFASRLSQAAVDLPLLRRVTLFDVDHIPGPGPDDDAEQTNGNLPKTASLAVLQYTSGSTSAPKGVQITHENFFHNAAAIAAAMGLDRHSQGINWAPLFHDMGLMFGVVHPLITGYPVTLLSPAALLARPSSWLQAIAKYGGTVSGGPNFAYDLCIEKINDEQLADIDLRTWTSAYTGAELIRAETLDRFVQKFGRCGFERTSFFPGYGLAEATLMVSGGPRARPPLIVPVDRNGLQAHGQLAPQPDTRSDAREFVSCGRPLDRVDVAIVDSRTRRKCGDDRVGEVWVRSPGVSQGYWNNPQQTSAVFGAFTSDPEEGPFMTTGDLGFMHDGSLFIVGRSKDLIIIRGINHYPEDIEQTVERSHLALRRSACAAFSTELNGEERLVIVQEVRRSWNADVDPIIEVILRQVVEQHAIAPHAVVLIRNSSLPKTTSGKVQRAATRQAFLQGGLDVVAEWRTAAHPHQADHPPYRAPQSRVQELLAGLWAQVLEIERVGIDDSFFDLGGHSHLLLRLHRKVEQTFARKIPLIFLFQRPTVRELAAFLVGASIERGLVATGRDRGMRRRSTTKALRQRARAPADAVQRD